MTTNKRAKRDARDRARKTGEPYTLARRRTTPASDTSRPTAAQTACSASRTTKRACSAQELCSQTASTIRYWRRIVRDGRIHQPDVREAIRTRVAHLLAGGYQEAARRLSPTSRVQVWERDGGRCVLCGQPGAEIDHITDDSRELGNLQLLYAGCHRAKTPPA